MYILKNYKNKHISILLLIFIFFMVYSGLSFTAPGEAYFPHHLANLFLENFGFDSSFSTLPNSGKTMLAFYSLNSIILSVFHNYDIVFIYKIIYVVDLISRLFIYIIIFKILHFSRILQLALSVLFAITIFFPGVPFLLISLILFTLSRCNFQVVNIKMLQSIVIFVITFTTLSLYWHTMSFLGFIITISYIIFKLNILEINKIRLQHFTFLTLSFLITTVIWIYLRDDSALAIFLKAVKHSEYANLDLFLKGLLTGGSFVEPLYRFSYVFFIPKIYVDIPRYISYIIIYIIIIIIILNKIKIINYDSKVLVISLFISDIFSKIFHYLASNTIATDVWSLLLYPVMFGIYCSKSKNIKVKISNHIYKILLIFFIFSIFSTFIFNFYINKTQLPSTQTVFEAYNYSFKWLATHSYESVVISDATTSGYFQIVYTMQRFYEKTLIFNREIGDDYYNIINKNYENNDNKILILNAGLYFKHLPFYSLKYWNTFEPISPECVYKTNLNKIFDNYMLIFII